MKWRENWSKTIFEFLTQWKTTSMEDNPNERRPEWKTNSMEDNFNERQPQWKTTAIEDYLDGGRHNVKE